MALWLRLAGYPCSIPSHLLDKLWQAPKADGSLFSIKSWRGLFKKSSILFFLTYFEHFHKTGRKLNYFFLNFVHLTQCWPKPANKTAATATTHKQSIPCLIPHTEVLFHRDLGFQTCPKHPSLNWG